MARDTVHSNGHASPPHPRRARVCVIRQFYFPLDPRVRREVRALTTAGHEVDVVCLRRGKEKLFERDGLVRTYRLPLGHRRGGPGRYVYEYATFGLAAALLCSLLHLRRRYRLVQVHSMPDVLVFAALVPKLTGARVLLDLHECMPEFFHTKFARPMTHPLVRLVSAAEQLSIRFADKVCTCTEQMREAFVSRGASPEKIRVVLNSADEELFDRKRYPPAPRHPERLTLVCHGSMEPLYGLDTVLHAMALLKQDVPGLRLLMFGDGTQADALRTLTNELELEDRVSFSDGFVPIEELLCAMASADAGVVAIRRDAFRDLVHCNKMFELIAMGKPVICSRTRSVQAYFGDDCFQSFTSGDERDLARAIRELSDEVALGEQLARRAEETMRAYRWERQRGIYQLLVDNLLGERQPIRVVEPAPVAEPAPVRVAITAKPPAEPDPALVPTTRIPVGVGVSAATDVGESLAPAHQPLEAQRIANEDAREMARP